MVHINVNNLWVSYTYPMAFVKISKRSLHILEDGASGVQIGDHIKQVTV